MTNVGHLSALNIVANHWVRYAEMYLHTNLTTQKDAISLLSCL